MLERRCSSAETLPVEPEAAHARVCVFCSHVGAVEEVSDGEQRRQDPLEGLIEGQLLHAQLQVKEWFCDLLQRATASPTHHTTYSSRKISNDQFSKMLENQIFTNNY